LIELSNAERDPATLLNLRPPLDHQQGGPGAFLLLKRLWRVFLYSCVYGYWLCVARDRSGQWRIYVSPEPTPSGFPARKGFFCKKL
jgi:hypothetical protein